MMRSARSKPASPDSNSSKPFSKQTVELAYGFYEKFLVEMDLPDCDKSFRVFTCSILAGLMSDYSDRQETNEMMHEMLTTVAKAAKEESDFYGHSSQVNN